MAENQPSGETDWKAQIVTRLIFPIIVGLVGLGTAFFLGRQTTPKTILYYEPTRPINFSSQTEEIAIVSLNVLNGGQTEIIEDVRVEMTLPTTATVRDVQVETSGGTTIQYNIEDVNEFTKLATIPILNRGQFVTFTFLLNGTTTKTIEAQVQGKGVVGELRPTTETQEPIILVVFSGALLGVTVLMFALVSRRLVKIVKESVSEET